MKKTVLIILAVLFCKSTVEAQTDESVDLNAVCRQISQAMIYNHFNPAELDSEEYRIIERSMYKMADIAQSKEEFVDNFNGLWSNGPFSHVSLAITKQNAADIANYFDELRVGEGAVSLKWENEIPILTVRTMIGVDTYESIGNAYGEINQKKAKAMIIDVRNNPGGAFAIIPLIGHVIDKPMEAGMFVSRLWWLENETAPTRDDVLKVSPWQGWSLKSFWNDVQSQNLLRVQFQPILPNFKGSVYILVNNKTASAAELAVDALANLEKVTIIGGKTAGQMLSQKMFDLSNDLQLSIPIAEYYSTRIGKIEGEGINVNLEVDSSLAKELALLLIDGKSPEEALTKLKMKE